MECFTHVGQSAVGICKACGKALCRSCAKDLTFALSCAGACEKEASEFNEMTQRGKRLYGIGTGKKKKLPSGVIIWMLFATFFGGYAIYRWAKTGEPEWFMLIFGALSACVAFMNYRRSKELGLQC